LKTAEKAAHILELARELPDTFGMSVSIHGQHETKDGETFARCSRIRSCDIVTDPAANPDGLLSEPQVDTKNNVCMGDTKKTEDDSTDMKKWAEETTKWRENSEKRFASLEALLGEMKRAMEKEEEKEEEEDMENSLSKTDFDSKMGELEAKLEAVSATLKNISDNANPAANSDASNTNTPKDFSEAVAMISKQTAGIKPTEAIKIAEKQFPELRKADLQSKGLQLI
jgi:molecular chaperone GrpE (heat shock protein)